jgi:hypothetical protein
MSIYQLHKLAYHVRNDAEYERRVQQDPAGVLEELDLTPDEAAALGAGDPRRLYELGMHAYLLQVLASRQVFGLSRDDYLDKLRAER